MAAPGATPIQIYYSTTASAVPSTSNILTAEFAVNVTDKKLYTKDGSGNLITLVGTLGNQDANNVAITGGAINGTTIGGSTAAAGTFTNLTASGTISLTGSIGVPLVISGSTSSDAVRITQTGSGNAFVVEDSANPDSTPFVIDADGRIIQGLNTSLTVPNYAGTASGPLLQTFGVVSSGAGYTGHTIGMFNNSTAAAGIIAIKSRGTTVGAQGIVNSGDKIFAITASGSDGTNFIRAADISFEVDGTPGTNDMPGRLVFSTTADGASSPTERMRIGNQGNIGIGIANRGDATLTISKTLTGATSVFGILHNGQIQSDVTGSLFGISTGFGTQATTFTLSNLLHYRAIQGTFGAGSTVTSQFGFEANSSLTGATNNYGFYSNIASGTGRWNFYANGTAANYMAGQLGLGSTTLNQGFLDINATSSSAQMGIRIGGTNTFAGTPQTLRLTQILTGTAATTSAYGFINANIYNFDAGATLADVYGVDIQPQLNGTVTPNLLVGVRSFMNMGSGATGGTVPNWYQFQAGGSVFNASATTNITNAYGFYSNNIANGAAQTITNAYGFYSNQTSGTGRWNFYANGTADNYFAGNVGIGTSSLGAKLEVAGFARFGNYGGTFQGITIQNNNNSASAETISFIDAHNNLNIPDSSVFFAHQTDGGSYIRFDTTPPGSRSSDRRAERMRITSAGLVLLNTTTNPTGGGVALAINGNGSANSNGGVQITYSGAGGGGGAITTPSGAGMQFFTFTGAVGSESYSERMRIDSSGAVIVGKSAITFGTQGAVLNAEGAFYNTFTRSGGPSIVVNRITNDGTLIEFAQDGTTEGTISVSGSTVSYNGGHLSRWSQWQNETGKPNVYRGTILESTNDMCEWEKDGEPLPNEQATKTIISNTIASKAVAGVFDRYDEDDENNPYDFYVAQSGDFVIRVAAGTVVQNGDLLESAGDGTARVQADDICRSSTIAKVTSNYVSETYADGSFCVPCILMIG